MNDQTKLAAAMMAGYVLGRTKQGKRALRMAMWLNGGGGGVASTLAQRATSELTGNIAVAGLLEQLRGPLADAGRKALTTALENRANSLADNLQHRAAGLSLPGKGKLGDVIDADSDDTDAEDDTESDVEPDEDAAPDEDSGDEDTDDEDAAGDEDSGDEDSGDEDSGDEDEDAEDEDEKKPPRRRGRARSEPAARGGRRSSAPAEDKPKRTRRAPAQSSKASSTPERKPRRPKPETPAKGADDAKKSTRKPAASRTAGSGRGTGTRSRAGASGTGSRSSGKSSAPRRGSGR